MKKVKVTQRPSGQDDFTLRPSRLRMFGIYIVMFTVALAAGLLLRMLVNGDGFSMEFIQQNWPTGVGVVILGAATLALIERSRWTLRVIGGGLLEGPTGAFGERLGIPLQEIDWERTRRSLSSRLKIGNAIYANSRQRIMISPWFFAPAEIKELFSRIGADRNLADRDLADRSL
jgi:hypothetical protein